MTNATEVTLRITSGPSREELFDALRLCAEGREVTFILDGEEPVGSSSYQIQNAPSHLRVKGVETQDCNGEYWKLLLGMGKGDDWVFSPNPKYQIIGYYDTRKRLGFISYVRETL